MRVIRKLLRFWRLAPAEQWFTVEALILPLAISAGFHLAGVPQTQGWLRRWTRIGRRPSAQDAVVNIRLACRAQQRVMRTTGILGPCLVRSLALWAMLLRRGLPVHLRVGFRKREGKIEGHAWVEHNGIPVNEDVDEARTFKVSDQPFSFDLWRPQQ
jgi:hypothetical protein